VIVGAAFIVMAVRHACVSKRLLAVARITPGADAA